MHCRSTHEWSARRKSSAHTSTEARSNQHYLVPMIFAVPVKSREHDRKDGGGVVADEAHDIPGRNICDLSVQFKNFYQLTHYSSSKELSLPPK